ncbi:acyltransferase family protein [Paenibacillus allorhizosphaerae]|uniref:Acyltransferase 3 domain-containing protein n=1 Tax=Paenibacillus allorhizosphaerae TaxID=2849866 RepID=A0ABN7TIK3_9BACL|nr:acyltransferase [Paenibacillus allorhizosphaerae]CAG7632626.1 hypothetical protein PAECIP111802_01864 [Paenibacillus allorhizosphaerae]
MKRFEELDSLRGLAAMSVLIGHCLIMLPYLTSKQYTTEMWVWNIIKFTPISAIWAGHEAVILFFILSGFVLSIPYNNGKELPYPTYLVRRICRIYIPYLFVIFLAILSRTYISSSQISIFSDWYNSLWRSDITIQTIIDHIIFLGKYDTNALNTVIWSLVEELRISIIFPFIMLLVIRFNWKINIGIGLTSSLISYAAYYIKWHSSNTALIKAVGYASTLEWLPMFIIGAVLAKNSNSICMLYKRLSRSTRIVMLLCGLMLYTYSHWMPFGGKLLHITIVEDWIILAGASIFIIFALFSGSVSRFLMFKPIHFIGKISYSIYLSHMIILLVMVNLLYGLIPLALIWLLTIILTIVISALMYFYIELPSIKLGRFLTKGITRRENSVVTKESNKAAST